MGSGKSSAAINYMNANPDKKFVYITPYLDEAKRIKDACPELRFVEPSGTIPEFEFKKYKHTLKLMQDGKNIASTHSMFLRYSSDMADAIRTHGYTLIIDEDVEVLSKCDTICREDVEMLAWKGYAEVSNGEVTLKNTERYASCGKFHDLFVSVGKNTLVEIRLEDESDEVSMFYWIFSREVLDAFSEVYVLTYMFAAQTIRRYFDLKGIEYEYIHTAYDGNNYSFTDGPAYIPEYTKHIKERLHIIEHAKLNDIGKGRCSLSANWYSGLTEGCEKAERLRKNLENFFKNVSPIKSCPQRMWSSFESGKKFLRGKGYFRSDTAFNMKATNEYRDKHVLAYLVNVFMNPFEKRYLTEHGVDVKEDDYALSVMVQWIWRSAIRDGGEIWVYIPSKRMRELLLSWMDSLEKGGAPDEIV